MMGKLYVADIKYVHDVKASTLPCKTEEKARFHAEAILNSMRRDAESQDELDEISKYHIKIE